MNDRAPSTPSMSLQQARAHFDAGDAVFVDTRSREDFERSQVPGAVAMPVAEVPRRYQELPRDRLIVFYCT
ncbi:MAG: rhodanese-like domain-containing protein [Chloroflexi bacterium]|nr:rhodanese-like domain-containing protein [Chloroflexota bacterium]